MLFEVELLVRPNDLLLREAVARDAVGGNVIRKMIVKAKASHPHHARRQACEAAWGRNWLVCKIASVKRIGADSHS